MHTPSAVRGALLTLVAGALAFGAAGGCGGESLPRHVRGCLDGQVDPGEACDDGNANDLDDCRNDCQANVCGDGLVNRDGPVGFEACDLGARNGITACAYGQVSCEACSATCQVVVPSVSYCGNGLVDGPIGAEACDDARSFACGTCDLAVCQVVGVSRATGRITVNSATVSDGDTFTLDDGANLPTTFELSVDATCARAGSVCVRIGAAPTVPTVVAAMREAIAGAAGSLSVQPDPTSGGPDFIALRNADFGNVGNTPIEVSGTSIAAAPAAGAIVVSGMRGGAGCAVGAPCSANRDCVSGSCGAASRTCRAP